MAYLHVKLYSQHFIFFETYERAQKANALHYTHIQRFARDKYSSLLGPWESYKENEMLWIQSQIS
jgi:hypothetical protein